VLTPIRPPIGGDVAEVDDMFGVKSVDKMGEPICLNGPKRQQKCLDPRRSDGEQRIQAHDSTVFPWTLFWGSRGDLRHVQGVGPPFEEL
jgi:hypothetical protein